MKTVILGATSGMGREMARQLAERGDALFLLGRDAASLARSAADLHARQAKGLDIRHAVCDLETPEQFGPALDQAIDALKGLDAVVVTAAMFAPQEVLERDTALTRRLVTVNFANSVVFCEEARKRLLANGGGRLTVFSSVAGDRGRKPVAIYGASKAGLTAYLEAIDYKFRTAGLSVLCVKPGFVHTEMTAGLPPPPFAGEVETVAAHVIRAMDGGKKTVLYTPSIWRLVMAVIRRLPRFVMRRIKF